MPGEPERIGQLKHLGQQIIVALAKMAALLVFIFAHWGLDAALRITARRFHTAAGHLAR